MSPIAIQHLYPIFVLILLNYITIVILAKRRFAAARKGQVPLSYYKIYQNATGAVLPEKAEQASRHYINLFEAPVMFYALIPLLILTQKTNTFSLVFSWLFVGTRYVHAGIHLTHNKIFWRMRSFFFGVTVLLILWVHFFIQITF